MRARALKDTEGREGSWPPHEIARLLDSTLLRPQATAEDVDQLCREAMELGVASVFIQPYWVPRARALLEGSSVAVGTVAGFPLGGSPAELKVQEAEWALERGAREIDFVINIGALRSGDLPEVARELRLMAEAVGGHGSGITKAIIECPLLGRQEVADVCRLAEEAGVDFIKTCTGYGPRGVTVEDVALLRGLLGPGMRIKASGGIRDLAQARALAEAGARRLGTSAAGRIVRGEKLP